MKKGLFILAIAAVGFTAQAQDSTSFFSEPEDGGVIMNRYVDIPMGTGSSLHRQGDWTIEALIKLPANYPSSQVHIVEAYTGSTSNGGFVLRISNNRIQAYAMTTSGLYNVNGINLIPGDEWTHIAAAYNETSGDMSLYINGSLDHTQNLGVDQFSDNIASMRIGARGDDANINLPCLIDEVRIWNTARDSNEIQATIMQCLTGSENGLEAYYNFEHDSNGMISDIASNGHDGTIVNDLGAGSFDDGAFACSTATLKEDALASISIYPNPASSLLSISSDAAINGVEVFDLSGSLIIEEISNTLNIESLESGIYLLNVHTEYGLKQMKFVKQ